MRPVRLPHHRSATSKGRRPDRPHLIVPALICDLRPGAAAAAAQYGALREAGEPLTLFWPHAAALPFRAITDVDGWDAALEDEAVACIAGCALPPAWLPVADMDRVWVVTPATCAGELDDSERRLVEALFAAGAEAVELVPPAALEDLSQSWHSGRRTSSVRLTPARR